MKLKMLPALSQVQGQPNGIARVIEAYHKHLPALGFEFTDQDNYDLAIVHAGTALIPGAVVSLHGLYWTADYPASAWEYKANANVVENIHTARAILVPSGWVAEPFRRDMHLNPYIVGHGIDFQEWQHKEPNEGYILFNKNRVGDVCSPQPIGELARRRPRYTFVTTFPPRTVYDNIRSLGGAIPFEQMKPIVQRAGVYLATTQETFGVGILESMAAGIPVLGFKHGGILDLVEHGQQGYLAEVNDYDDLAAGLDWCFQHRAAIGAQGRERAKEFTWEKAVQRLAAVLEEIAQPQPPSVAIIVPSWNYAAKVARAARSALAQTYPVEQVIVVDDGSPDEGATQKAVEELIQETGDTRLRYVRQEHAGVAIARNYGIALADTKYVVPLDADDEIAPTLVAKLLPAMEADPGLGVAYSALLMRNAQGQTAVSSWPGPWDYDRHVQDRSDGNQIPTCVLLRREAWRRLGGYRQRYAPQGAGAEDAEFWLRCGAYGWRAAQVTTEPLFIYTTGQGATSKPDYHQVNYRAWHPWVFDGQHPFASWAKPKKMSHLVRAYDKPRVSVVIPVGPGHARNLINALDSLEAQTFRNWEAIVVDDTADQANDAAHSELRAVLEAYPFVRLARTKQPQSGPGAARNVGGRLAKAPLLLFLDADDWLLPGFLERTIIAHEQTGAAIYTNYQGLANVKDATQLDPKLQGRIRQREGDLALIGYEWADYRPEFGQIQPGERPYIWCLISTLHPTAWFREIAFDESLNTWEDVDYFWRMAKAGHCFALLPEELMVYSFSTGQRRELGYELHQEVLHRLAEKYREVPIVPCSGCPRPSASAPGATPRPIPTGRESPAVDQNDANFRLIRYASGNVGEHPVVGVITHQEYGYRRGGDVFLVHVKDIAAIPSLFIVQETPRPEPAPAPAAPPPPPPPAPAPPGPAAERIMPPAPEAPAIPEAKAARQRTPAMGGIRPKRGGGPSNK